MKSQSIFYRWYKMEAKRVAVVTGAYGFLGRRICVLLAKDKYILVALGRDKRKLEELIASIKEHSCESMYFICDVRKQEQVAGVVNDIMGAFGRIDVLINAAGIGNVAEFKNTNISDVRNTFMTNYFGTVFLIKSVLPHMIAKQSGKIINVSSLGGKLALPGLSAYSASKFAINGFSESIYYELKKRNISVSLICPGRFYATKAPITDLTGISVDKVAKTIIRSVTEKKFEHILPRRAILLLAKRLILGLRNYR